MSGTTGVRYYTPSAFEIDANGVPLAGAQLFFWETGTSTPQDTFQDVNLTTPNANPVIADANGRFGSIFLIPSPAYKTSLFTAPTVQNPSGVQIWTFDPVGPGSGAVIQNTAGIVGEVRAFAGVYTAIPPGWLECYGQSLSQSTYSALYAVIGTTWGTGSGAGQFSAPDLRGRALFGKDDMNFNGAGNPANVLTSGGSGVAGNALGTLGGNQLLQSHLHTLNDPEHTHTVTDPGHFHTLDQSNSYQSNPQSSPARFTLTNNAASAVANTSTVDTGITIDNAATGITMDTAGGGITGSQNVPPAAVVYLIIYAGV